MSPLTAAHQLVARASSAGLLSPNDVRLILSDALLSFSPLAVLVGADSARVLAHRVTNMKQSFVVALAPIGALGMMATACKGANLPGFKEMLGVGEGDINDAARELGCGAVSGDAVPRMDTRGGLVSTVKGDNIKQAACAIVRLDWKTRTQTLDFNALHAIVENFVAGTMSGRVMWNLSSEQEVKDTIQKVQLTFLYSLRGSGLDAFEELHELRNGRGIIELHWPAPAMPLETHSFVIYSYGVFFVVGFLTVAILATTLSWQSPLSSALLLGGQTLLLSGHVAVQYSVKYQRETLQVVIPATGITTHWMMIDKTRFASFLARRSFPRSFTALFPTQITLSQHHKFKGKYVVTWHALLTLIVLTVGFMTFYVGGKSSNVKTVIIYVGLFILANMTKGLVVHKANKPYYTCLNNFGHDDVVARYDDKPTTKVGEDIEMATMPSNATPILTIPMSARAFDTSGSIISELPPLDDWTQTFPAGFCVYSKFSIHSPEAMEMFCFSSTDEWAMAAHTIKNTVEHFEELGHSGNLDQHEKLLQIPLYQWQPDQNGGNEQFHGLLLMEINGIKLEDLFWSVGMEIVTILVNNYDNCNMLCSESKDTTNISFLAALVYSCTRMLLSKQVYAGEMLLPVNQRGVQCLMLAIEEITRNIKNPYDYMPSIAAELNAAADKAKLARGAKSKAKVDVVADEDEEFKRLKESWKSQKEKELKDLEVSLEALEHWSWRLLEVESKELQELQTVLRAVAKHGSRQFYRQLAAEAENQAENLRIHVDVQSPQRRTARYIARNTLQGNKMQQKTWILWTALVVVLVLVGALTVVASGKLSRVPWWLMVLTRLVLIGIATPLVLTTNLWMWEGLLWAERLWVELLRTEKLRIEQQEVQMEQECQVKLEQQLRALRGQLRKLQDRLQMQPSQQGWGLDTTGVGQVQKDDTD
jgi:hypothetical protein